MSEAADTPPTNSDILPAARWLVSFQLCNPALKCIIIFFFVKNVVGLNLWKTDCTGEFHNFLYNTLDKLKKIELIQNTCSQNTKELN